MEAVALRLFWALAAAALWLAAAPRPSSAGTCRQVQPAADHLLQIMTPWLSAKALYGSLQLAS